jgi:hypothetical protein
MVGSALILINTPALAKEAPTVTEGSGLWSLKRLGAGRLSLPVGGEFGKRSVAIAFPKGAKQPRDPLPDAPSYVIHMDLSLTVSRFSKSGVVVVSGLTDGCPSAQVSVHVRGGQKEPAVRWTSTDLIHGVRGRRVEGRRVFLRFSNYLPFCGVRPGPTKLSFTLQKLGQVKLERAVILPSSGIEVTDRYRPQLRLRPVESSEVPVVGKKFTVGLSLENIGDLPARGVGVELRKNGGPVAISGSGLLKIGDLTGRTAGRFEVVAKRAGEFQLDLQVVAGNANRPATTIEGTVVSAPSPGSVLPGLWLTLGWALAVLVSGVVFLRMWRRRQRVGRR